MNKTNIKTYSQKIIVLALMMVLAIFVLMPIHADATVADDTAGTGNVATAASDDDTTADGDEEERPNDIIAVRLQDLSFGESVGFAFTYGYQALVENKCEGAMLTFDDNGNYLAGYLSPLAPDDFCVRISPDTISVPLCLPYDMVVEMYNILNDRLSVSLLLGHQEDFYNVVLMFRPEKDMELPPVWYARAENKISDAAFAHGIEPKAFYEIMQHEGFSKDELVASVAKGSNENDMMLDALELVNSRNKGLKNERITTNITLLLEIVMGIGILAIILIIVNLIIMKKSQASEDRLLEENLMDSEDRKSATPAEPVPGKADKKQKKAKKDKKAKEDME